MSNQRCVIIIFNYQIGMRNGVLQSWGLVEFFDAMQAELTQEKLNGHQINGTKIKVQFCIPGVNAINIHMRVVNAPETSVKGLIDEVPGSSVYSQLQKLSNQNPACKYFSLCFLFCQFLLRYFGAIYLFITFRLFPYHCI